MSFRSAVFLVVANMVGVGVFTTSGFALGDLGHPVPVLVAWALGGLLALCGALCYGALARSIGRSGGEYTYLTETVHPVAGKAAGWVSLGAGFSAPIAAAALTLCAYASVPQGWQTKAVATAVVLIAGALHGFRGRAGIAAQNVAVGLKLVAIVAFIVLGAGRLDHVDTSLPPAEGWDFAALAVTLVWVSFSYSGWNAAVYVSAEVRGGGRRVEGALVAGTALVTALYLGLNAVFVWSAPVSELAGQASIGTVAAGAIGGQGSQRALAALVVLALFTSVSSMVMTGPRVIAEMAKDGALPRMLASQEGAPTAAVAVQVGVAVLLCWVSSLRELLSMIGFLLGLSAAATVGGFLWWRRHQEHQVKIWGGPVVPGLFIGVTLVISAYLVVQKPTAALWGAVVVLLGVLSHAVRQDQRT